MSDILGIMGLLNPKMAEKMQDYENRYRAERCKRGGLKKWDEVLEYGDVYVDSDSFVQAEDHLIGKVTDKEIVVHNGKTSKNETRRWMQDYVALDRILLPADHPIRFANREEDHYYVCFNKPINVVRLKIGGATMMSIVPWECMSQRRGIHRARGHTVIAGLGLGWSLTRILKSPRVDRVTVIERHPKLLAKMRTLLKAEKLGKPIDWICGDMWEEAPKLTADLLFADIWSGYGDVHDERKKLKATCPNISSFWLWGIGGSADYKPR